MASLDRKELANIRHLYERKNLSAREIADVYNVSIDAVYYFMRANKIARRSLSDQNKVRFERKIPSFSIKKRLSSADRDLKIIGVVLYWGEGHKAEGAGGIDFANSDVEMVITFVRFLRVVCGVSESRIRPFVYCYSNQSPSALIRFWSKRLNIPVSQFTKPYVRSDFQREKVNRMPYGLVHIRYSDKKLLFLVKEWIKEYKDKHCVGTQAVNGDAL